MKFLTLTTLTSLLAALTAASPLHPTSTAPSISANGVEIGDVAVSANTTALRAAPPLHPTSTAPSISAIDAEFGDVALNATRTLLTFGDKTALKPKQTPRLVVYTANDGDETCENGLAKSNKWKHAWYLPEGECHNFDTAWTGLTQFSSLGPRICSITFYEFRFCPSAPVLGKLEESDDCGADHQTDRTCTKCENLRRGVKSLRVDCRRNEEEDP